MSHSHKSKVSRNSNKSGYGTLRIKDFNSLGFGQPREKTASSNTNHPANSKPQDFKCINIFHDPELASQNGTSNGHSSNNSKIQDSENDIENQSLSLKSKKEPNCSVDSQKKSKSEFAGNILRVLKFAKKPPSANDLELEALSPKLKHVNTVIQDTISKAEKSGCNSELIHLHTNLNTYINGMLNEDEKNDMKRLVTRYFGRSGPYSNLIIPKPKSGSDEIDAKLMLVWRSIEDQILGGIENINIDEFLGNDSLIFQDQLLSC